MQVQSSTPDKPLVSFSVQAFSYLAETRINREATTRVEADSLFREVAKTARGLLKIGRSIPLRVELRKVKEGNKKSVVLRSIVSA